MARLRLRVVAQDADGDVIGQATVKLYEPGTASVSGSSTTGTPFAGSLYAAVSGGSPISTTQTADANGQVVVFTDSASRVDVGVEKANHTPRVFSLEPFEYDPADVLLTGELGLAEGDLFYVDDAAAVSRLPKGTARQQLQMNAAADAPEWASSPASLLSGQGDILYASAANTPARLAIGTARQILATNAAGTAPEWVASPASLMTTQGDILIASGANTPARLARGSAHQALLMNGGGTVPEWGASMQSLLTAQGDLPYASAANTPARLAKGTARQALAMNAGATAPEWVASPASLLTTTGDILYASAANTPARLAMGSVRQVLRRGLGETVPTWGSTPDALNVYNVLQYGLAQSGTNAATQGGASTVGADNAAALQVLWRALSALNGGTVFFPPGGAYPFAGTTTLDHDAAATNNSAINVIGSGWGGAIDLYGTTGHAWDLAPNSSSGMDKGFFRDLVFQVKEARTAGSILRLGQVRNYLFENIHIVSGAISGYAFECVRYGNAALPCNNNTFRSCYFVIGSLTNSACFHLSSTATAGSGVSFGGLMLDNCSLQGISNAAGAGIYFANTYTFDSGYIHHSGFGTLAYGIQVPGFGQVVNMFIDSTYLDDCSVADIFVESAADISNPGEGETGIANWNITDNWLSANHADGQHIILSAAGGTLTNFKINNNYMTTSTLNVGGGITVGDGCSRVTITNNTIGAILPGVGGVVTIGNADDVIVMGNFVDAPSPATASILAASTADPIVVVGNISRGADISFGGSESASRVYELDTSGATANTNAYKA